MCSIIGSFSRVPELVELNQHRGNFSYSVSDFSAECFQFTHKSFDEFVNTTYQRLHTEGNYTIAHVQAPTGGMIAEESRIHPTFVDDSMLWHNGIITPRGIRFLQSKLETTENFDTKLLHLAIMKFGFDILSEIEGLFSCVLYKNNNFHCFRTKHGKIYIDNDFNISSEKFDNSKCINSDTVYIFNPFTKSIDEVSYFKTKRFNIVIEGEL